MIQTTEKLYTVEEYFELEKIAEIRHEFVNGTLITMMGDSKIANQIVGNCCNYLDPIQDKQFEIYALAVRLIVDPYKIYRYPDLVIIPDTDNFYNDATTQPVLIIEVLSESTEFTDRGDKLRQYSNLPSLQYYLLISQNEPVVEMYTREGNRWLLEFFTSLENVIHLPALETTLPLQAIYKKVKFNKMPDL